MIAMAQDTPIGSNESLQELTEAKKAPTEAQVRGDYYSEQGASPELHKAIMQDNFGEAQLGFLDRMRNKAKYALSFPLNATLRRPSKEGQAYAHGTRVGHQQAAAGLHENPFHPETDAHYHRGWEEGHKAYMGEAMEEAEQGIDTEEALKKAKKKSASGDTSSDVRSPTSTKTATKTATKTKTSTSTDAYTARNITVTGGAGDGNTTVHIHADHEDEHDTPRSGGPHPDGDTKGAQKRPTIDTEEAVRHLQHMGCSESEIAEAIEALTGQRPATWGAVKPRPMTAMTPPSRASHSIGVQGRVGPGGIVTHGSNELSTMKLLPRDDRRIKEGLSTSELEKERHKKSLSMHGQEGIESLLEGWFNRGQITKHEFDHLVQSRAAEKKAKLTSVSPTHGTHNIPSGLKELPKGDGLTFLGRQAHDASRASILGAEQGVKDVVSKHKGKLALAALAVPAAATASIGGGVALGNLMTKKKDDTTEAHAMSLANAQNEKVPLEGEIQDKGEDTEEAKDETEGEETKIHPHAAIAAETAYQHAMNMGVKQKHANKLALRTRDEYSKQLTKSGETSKETAQNFGMNRANAHVHRKSMWVPGYNLGSMKRKDENKEEKYDYKAKEALEGEDTDREQIAMARSQDEGPESNIPQEDDYYTLFNNLVKDIRKQGQGECSAKMMAAEYLKNQGMEHPALNEAQLDEGELYVGTQNRPDLHSFAPTVRQQHIIHHSPNKYGNIGLGEIYYKHMDKKRVSRPQVVAPPTPQTPQETKPNIFRRAASAIGNNKGKAALAAAGLTAGTAAGVAIPLAVHHKKSEEENESLEGFAGEFAKDVGKALKDEMVQQAVVAIARQGGEWVGDVLADPGPEEGVQHDPNPGSEYASEWDAYNEALNDTEEASYAPKQVLNPMNWGRIAKGTTRRALRNVGRDKPSILGNMAAERGGKSIEPMITANIAHEHRQKDASRSRLEASRALDKRLNQYAAPEPSQHIASDASTPASLGRHQAETVPPRHLLSNEALREAMDTEEELRNLLDKRLHGAESVTEAGEMDMSKLSGHHGQAPHVSTPMPPLSSKGEVGGTSFWQRAGAKAKEHAHAFGQHVMSKENRGYYIAPAVGAVAAAGVIAASKIHDAKLRREREEALQQRGYSQRAPLPPITYAAQPQGTTTTTTTTPTVRRGPGPGRPRNDDPRSKNYNGGGASYGSDRGMPSSYNYLAALTGEDPRSAKMEALEGGCCCDEAERQYLEAMGGMSLQEKLSFMETSASLQEWDDPLERAGLILQGSDPKSSNVVNAAGLATNVGASFNPEPISNAISNAALAVPQVYANGKSAVRNASQGKWGDAAWDVGNAGLSAAAAIPGVGALEKSTLAGTRLAGKGIQAARAVGKAGQVIAPIAKMATQKDQKDDDSNPNMHESLQEHLMSTDLQESESPPPKAGTVKMSGGMYQLPSGKWVHPEHPAIKAHFAKKASDGQQSKSTKEGIGGAIRGGVSGALIGTAVGMHLPSKKKTTGVNMKRRNTGEAFHPLTGLKNAASTLIDPAVDAAKSVGKAAVLPVTMPYQMAKGTFSSDDSDKEDNPNTKEAMGNVNEESGFGKVFRAPARIAGSIATGVGRGSQAVLHPKAAAQRLVNHPEFSTLGADQRREIYKMAGADDTTGGFRRGAAKVAGAIGRAGEFTGDHAGKLTAGGLAVAGAGATALGVMGHHKHRDEEHESLQEDDMPTEETSQINCDPNEAFEKLVGMGIEEEEAHQIVMALLGDEEPHHEEPDMAPEGPEGQQPMEGIGDTSEGDAHVQHQVHPMRPPVESGPGMFRRGMDYVKGKAGATKQFVKDHPYATAGGVAMGSMVPAAVAAGTTAIALHGRHKNDEEHQTESLMYESMMTMTVPSSSSNNFLESNQMPQELHEACNAMRNRWQQGYAH